MVDPILEAAKKAKMKLNQRKTAVIQTVKNNNPFDKKGNRYLEEFENTSNSSLPSIYSINKQSMYGMDYAMSLCKFNSSSNENVSSLTINEKLLTDQGFSLVCQYLSYGFYPHLRTLSIEDNLLSDSSIFLLSSLITGGFCPELKSIYLSSNYINEDVCNRFLQFCNEYNIIVSMGGYPNFSLASVFPSHLPPVLFYRVVTFNPTDSLQLLDNIHYSNFAKMGEWCSDEGKSIVGIQLFYYGVGKITAKIYAEDGSFICGNGECGNLILFENLQPVVKIDYGSQNTSYSIVGMVNQAEGKILEVKVNLVAQ